MYSMKTWADVYIVYIVRLVDVDWMFLEEVGLLVVCWEFGSLRSKSVEKLPNFPLAGLEPMPHVTVALTAQYLNVRQRKLGTIIIQTVHILQHDSAAHIVTVLVLTFPNKRTNGKRLNELDRLFFTIYQENQSPQIFYFLSYFKIWKSLMRLSSISFNKSVSVQTP